MATFLPSPASPATSGERTLAPCDAIMTHRTDSRQWDLQRTASDVPRRRLPPRRVFPDLQGLPWPRLGVAQSRDAAKRVASGLDRG